MSASSSADSAAVGRDGQLDAPPLTPEQRWYRRAVLFPNLYTCFVFIASLDIITTWTILWLGGEERNPLADFILNLGDMPLMVAFKLFMTVLVVVICEIVGRKHWATAKRLALFAVSVSSIPVLWGVTQLWLVYVLAM